MSKKYLWVILTVILSINWYNAYALSGWSYYRDITIDNTENNNALTDYQVLVTVDTATIISEGKMNNDCSDIRFTESDGITELSYWIEDGTCNTATTKIWVKVPSIPAASTYTIQMWYGNPSATSASSIDNTFIFGDDFEDGTIDATKWNVVDSTGISETGGQLVTISSDGLLHSIPTFSEGIVVETSVMPVSIDAGGLTLLGFWASTADDICYHAGTTAAGADYVHNDGTWNSLGVINVVWNVNNRVIFKPNGGSVSIDIYREDTGASVYSGVWTNTVLNEYIRLGRRADDTLLGGSAEAHWNFIFVRAYTDPEPTTSVGAEQQPIGNYIPQITITSPTATTYYGITSQTFTFKVVDMDNATIIVRAYLNGTLIYEDTAYTNDTIVSFTHPVAGYGYNFTVYATDNIDDNSQEVDFYVWQGANITANTNAFDLTVGIGGINTTYTGIDYKEIEWKDVGNNTYAELWITKDGFDMDYKTVLFNDTMGVLDVQLNIYTAYTFWLYDTENGKFIKDWTLTIVNSTDTYVFSTTDYDVKVSTRMINEGTYTLNATAFGYDYVTEVMLLNNSVALNYTFNTKPTDFIINIYDEETLNEIENTTLKLYFSNGKQIEYVNNKSLFSYSSSLMSISGQTYVSDYDESTYASCIDSDANNPGSCTFEIQLGISNDIGRICMKTKGDILETGSYWWAELSLYNYTSASYQQVYYSGSLYEDNIIKEICVNYDNSNNDYTTTARVKIKLSEYSYSNLYLYEVYVPEMPAKNKYVFDSTQVIDIESIEVSRKDYALRKYYVTVPVYSSLSLDAYLLGSDIGRTIAFNIVNSRDESIYDAKVSALSYIKGAYRVVAQAKTDASATAYLFLKPGKEYYIKVEHPNYVSFYKQIIPYATSYRIKLSNVLDINFDSLFNGVSYALLPRGNSITDEITTFIFRVSSINSDIEYMKLIVNNKNSILILIY